MSTARILALVAIFFFTSIVSVVTGSTSLITVPVMIAMGIEAHIAIAKNMLALTFMSVGGSLPFLGKGVFSRTHLPLSILLTVIGSALGALLLLSVPTRALRIVIGITIIVIACLSVWDKNAGSKSGAVVRSRAAVVGGYVATLGLGVYGGFFSGGYVTLLTTAFVFLFGMSFLQVVATTKVVNVFSSGIATLVLLWRGIVNLKLGLVLGIAMFLGALLGGRLTLRLSEVWLRTIFVLAVLGLAIKMLWIR